MIMHEKAFEMIADQVFERSNKQYEKDIAVDTSQIKSNEDFFKYIDKRVEAVRAHNERYTSELVKRVIDFYERKDQE